MSDNVYAGANGIDQGIDSEQQAEALKWQSKALEQSGEHDEIGAWDSGYALAREFEGEKNQQLLIKRERNVCGLGDEKGGEPEEERTAAEIEAETEWRDDPENTVGYTETFHVLERLGQGGCAGGGTERDEEGLACEMNKPTQRYSE